MCSDTIYSDIDLLIKIVESERQGLAEKAAMALDDLELDEAMRSLSKVKVKRNELKVKIKSIIDEYSKYDGIIG